MSEPNATSPTALADRLAAGDAVSVLDVRDRDEFEAWHVDGPGVEARQVPHVRFIEARVGGDPAELVADLPEPIVVVCGRGEASGEVADDLREAGLDASNLAGGMAAWARVYRATDVHDGAVTVRQYDRPASGCLGYLVVSGDEAVVVDPLRAFAERYEADAADLGAAVVAAVDTHVHADHVSGTRAVAERTGAAVVAPAGAADRGLDYATTLVGDGDRLPVGDVALEAVHAPGHTSEMTAFRLDLDDESLLFGGDLLFGRSVARPDLEDGSDGAATLARDLHHTLTERLGELPDDAVVLPGHRDPGSRPVFDGVYGGRLAGLRERVRIEDDPEAFADRVATDLPARPANYERIVATNLGRESMADEAAFEAELGPNNCAVDAD